MPKKAPNKGSIEPLQKPKKKSLVKQANSQDEPSPQLSGNALPRRSLEDCLIVVHKLRDIYAGKSATLDELSSAIGMARTNNNFKYIIWSAAAYGLVNVENENPKTYSLSETGRKIVAETYPGESREAKTKAVLTPTILSQFFTDYNGSPLPSEEHFANVLENRYHVPRERTAEAINLIVQNGMFSGILSVGEDSVSLTVTLKGAPSGTKDDRFDKAAPVASIKAAPTELSQKQQAAWETTCFYKLRWAMRRVKNESMQT